MNTEMMKEKNDYKKIVIAVMLFLVTALTGFYLLGDNMETILRFWLALFVLGIVAFPLTIRLFPTFANGGYLYSKIIGLFLGGYLMWLLSSVKLLKFTTTSSIVCTVIVAVIIYGIIFLYNRKKTNKNIFKGLDQKWFSILMSEIFFLLMFIFFIYLLGNKIPGVETEKSMDYAFMSTIMHTEYMPPVDMWAAGKTLNYYYFGQYIMTYLTRISFMEVRFGYTLSMAVIAAFCFVLVVNLVYEIMHYNLLEREFKRYLSVIAAFLSGIAVTFSGNMHYFIFAKVTPAIWDIFKIPGEKPTYWFADSTRYIGYTPDVVGDKTIAEFPFYSFLIGDLHAHVIDIIVVLTITALLFSYIIRIKKEEKPVKWYQSEILCPQLLMIGFLIGISCMTNYWDYPIYFVVSGSVVLLWNGIQYKFKGKTFYTTALQGLLIFSIVQLISLPFTLKFEQMIMGIRLCTTHSRFYQFCILWGFPILMVIGIIVTVVRESFVKKIKLPVFFKTINRADLFVVLMGLCATGLVIMPEIIYVRDIYEEGFPRANTMFKLTYEAFILFGISLGYIITKFLCTSTTKTQKKAGIVGLICLMLTSGYCITSSKMWLGNYLDKENFKGIDASVYFTEYMKEDMDAVTWLTENVDGQPVILEADGDSYTNAERVSVLTGLPTVLGWHTHEWLWRNGYSIIEERQADITEIYTGNSKENVEELLKKYNVSYIFIGSKEYEKYPDMDIAFLEGLGEVVFESFDDSTLRSTEIIRIQ